MERSNKSRVLVTGATGYIASHIIAQLLDSGWAVRGTVRANCDPKRLQHLRNRDGSPRAGLDLIEADLLDPDSWAPAVEGCEYVIHVASPFPSHSPYRENDVLRPAVEGTMSVLQACLEPRKVKRVVLTSSITAVAEFIGENNGKAVDESNWTEVEHASNPYVKSKVQAEKAAWDFMATARVHGLASFELVSMNPALVLGPALGNAFCTSMELVKKILEHTPGIPDVSFPVVDVRDVARAHIAALTSPACVGERHILSAGNMQLKDIAKIIENEFRPQGYVIPSTHAPYFFVWLASFFDKTLAMILKSIGSRVDYNNDRMVYVLGIKPVDMEASIIDMCYSVIDKGFVKKTARYRGHMKKKDEEDTPHLSNDIDA